MIVSDSRSHPELGTAASPTVVEAEPAPLGSAFNPIVIHVDEKRCDGEAASLFLVLTPTS